jgi:hypothetical protein
LNPGALDLISSGMFSFLRARFHFGGVRFDFGSNILNPDALEGILTAWKSSSTRRF